MAAETIIEYNVLFKNSKPVVMNDVLALMRLGSVAALNEGARGNPRNGILAACKKDGWRFADGAPNWLIWDPRVWRAVGRMGQRKISPSAKELGLPFKYSPERTMIWQRLQHIASDAIHWFHVTHLVQGYAKPEGAFSDKFEAYKDLAAKQGVLSVHTITERHIKRSNIDFHHLLGDMNVRQANEQRPWYPANVWDDLWVPDTRPGSIDWMLHSRESRRNGLRVLSRDAIERVNLPGHNHDEPLDSDHLANRKRVRWPDAA